MEQEGQNGSLFEAPAEPPESAYSVEAQARSDRSIRNQLRNLALLQPVFRLDLNSAHSGGDEFSFDELDAKALALIAFDFISYKMVMSLGARHDEIIVHFAEQAARMNLTLNRSARYAAVAYGSGNALTGTGGAGESHLDLIRARVGAETIQYFGDLGPEGVRIPEALDQARREQGLPGLKPAQAFYTWLLDNGIEEDWSRAIHQRSVRR